MNELVNDALSGANSGVTFIGEMLGFVLGGIMYDLFGYSVSIVGMSTLSLGLAVVYAVMWVMLPKQEMLLREDVVTYETV